MTVGSGFGAGAWGGVPWGSAKQLLEEVECDLFLFEEGDTDCGSMADILSSPITEATGDPTQFVLDYPDGPTPPDVTCDLGILSGDLGDAGFPTSTAYLTAFPTAIDSEYTVELTVLFEELPNDFADLTNRHFMFGATDTTGPCAAIFVSKLGLAYAGAVHHVPSAPALVDLVLDSTFQQIPGTASLITFGEYITFRVAVSEVVGAVYVFVTKTADLPITGHQLVAVLPTIDASALSFPPPIDRALISARGTTAQPTRVSLDRWCLSSEFLVPNIAPVANAGQDQAIRLCSIAQLDGSASFDPEGAPLLYQWRLIDGPEPSEYVIAGADGTAYPIAPFTGFTNRFHSDVLGTVEPIDSISIGDVLLVQGQARTIIGKGTDLNGFFVVVAVSDIPYPLAGEPFKLLRQRGITGAATINPTFFPDVPGFYKFDLTVFDGGLYSASSIVILNVLESVLPRGCTPNMNFMFSFVSDFWSLVEDSDQLEVFWGGMAQVAASELYTLWQHEYSKSLRDVQRTVVRRWLHYDLLLPEPIPELTQIRALWAGVESVSLLAVANPGTDGTSLVLSSPLFEDLVVLDFVSSTTPAEFASELRNRLLEIDSRFSVELITERTGVNQVVRIDAPFPFTVDSSSTVPAFIGGSSNSAPSGTGGAANGPRTYVLDRTLQGLDIREDDMLVVDGVGYRIVRVVDPAPADPDTFNQQRVTLKDALPVPVGSDWTVASTVSSELLDFYNGLVSDGDDVFFEVAAGADTPTLTASKALGACAALPGVLPVDIVPVGAELADETSVVRLAKIVRRTYLPVSDLIRDVPTLQEHPVIVDDEATLRRNVDYFLEQYRDALALRFVSGLGGQLDVWEGQVPPDRLWAEYSFIDNRPTIESNFGIPAAFSLDQLATLTEEIDYLSAVSGLWYAYFNGPTLSNMRIGAQIFLGLPFAEETGVIEEIRRDFSTIRARILVRDVNNTEIVRAYRFPNELELEINPATGERYVEGDTVQQFAPLVEGVEVADYIKEPDWFRGLIQQGIFKEVQKYHTFTVRINSEIFNIPSLVLVRDFILQIKPTYTYPVFLVSFNVGVEDVNVSDQIRFGVKLILNDTPCGDLGSTMFDDARPGGGGYWNQFDTDDDDGSPPPTYPTSDPDGSIVWGFDKQYLCPFDELFATCIMVFPVPTPVAFDDCVLAFDTPVDSATRFSDAGPLVVPALPGELSLTPVAGATAPLTGTLSSVLLEISGGPGAFGTDYELVVTVAGGDAAVVPFVASAAATVVNVPIAGAVTAGDAIGLKIRIPVGAVDPGPRSPAWTTVSGRVVIEDGIWAFDDVLPAGTYIGTTALL